MSKADQPSHYTQHGTRKFQANAPVMWGAVFRRAAGADAQEGEGIRAALAYAVEHQAAFLSWAKGHPDAWARASTAPAAKGATRAAKAPGRAAKRAGKRAAAKVGVKAPKVPKAPKAKRPPEQQSLPEVK